MLKDKINKEIQEIDRRIANIQLRAEEEVKDLRRRRQALDTYLKVITPELEAAMAALDAAGINISR